MNQRVVVPALVAAASCVLAVAGFVLSGSLEFFAPCRAIYRTHRAVQDSLACQSYSAITLFSLLLSLAAAGFAVAAAVLAFLQQRGTPSTAGRGSVRRPSGGD